MDLTRIEKIVGKACKRAEPLGRGAAGSVSRILFKDGTVLVAKTGVSLLIEARMLRVLAERSRLPVPRVEYADDTLLLMQEIPGRTSFDAVAEAHAAELLCELHGVVSPDGHFGLEFDNLIGPLHQPNAWSASWPEFFRERRLLHMAEHAASEGYLPRAAAERVGRVAARLNELVPERPPASLLHGDIWTGNVLAESGRITAFLDPAVYYGHAEVELAFITLFSTFGESFFARYHERRPLDPEFMRTRRHVYNLYPLLVHVRIYKGGYVDELERTLGSIGF